MKAEIICIGTELLLGEIVDTNASYLARSLAQMGIDLYHKTTVGDNLERAAGAIRQALDRADVVLVSGGLGPTQDDLTREAIAVATGVPLEMNNDALTQVESWFSRMKRPMTDNNRRQALFPHGATPILNTRGTAPGIWLEVNGHAIAAMPGVPRELITMMEESVGPLVQSRIPAGERKVLRSRVIRLVGIGESAVEDRIMPLILSQTNPTIAPYAGDSEVRLRLTASACQEAEALALLDGLEAKVRADLGGHIYGLDQDTLELALIRRLAGLGKTLAVAESCTGGLVAHRLTNVSGSSEVFIEGCVTYDNRAKTARLGVDRAIIDQFGAVSEPVARAMAEGIRRSAGVDFGLATTGIAGPGGGSPEKPVGLVYAAVSGSKGTRVVERRFGSERVGNKQAFSQSVLGLLWQVLSE